MKYEQPTDKKRRDGEGKPDLEERLKKWEEELERGAEDAYAGQSESTIASDEETKKIYAELESRVNQIAKPEGLNKETLEDAMDEADKIKFDMEKEGWKLLDTITNAAVVKEIEPSPDYDYKIIGLGKVFLVFSRPKSEKVGAYREGGQMRLFIEQESGASGQESRGVASEIEEGDIKTLQRLAKLGYEQTDVSDNPPGHVKRGTKVIKNIDDGRYHVFEPKNE